VYKQSELVLQSILSMGILMVRIYIILSASIKTASTLVPWGIGIHIPSSPSQTNRHFISTHLYYLGSNDHIHLSDARSLLRLSCSQLHTLASVICPAFLKLLMAQPPDSLHPLSSLCTVRCTSVWFASHSLRPLICHDLTCITMQQASTTGRDGLV
jgi:hypothetical protein